ncbi:hypothetical protein Clow_02304 [Corynebacterium lowii]|uniref:Uncharacterized protein n=1 Tax=Corynebacterium lowii TaxID=1544413 RepID=A0A0Q0UAB1_9CORY|nr:hypothetical protein Clow_02304 [Corynebacterium lowii]
MLGSSIFPKSNHNSNDINRVRLITRNERRLAGLQRLKDQIERSRPGIFTVFQTHNDR